MVADIRLGCSGLLARDKGGDAKLATAAPRWRLRLVPGAATYAQDADSRKKRGTTPSRATGQQGRCCGSPKFPTLDHRNSPGDERRGGLDLSLRNCQAVTS